MTRATETPSFGNALTTSEWPRITIVTPSYNHPEYLEEAIRSVLRQEYPNLEYMVVDGASPDPRVLEVIRKYEKHLAWWVSEPDGGHAEAIAKGFARATGEILAWLCSDDVYEPGALWVVARTFREHPEADVVFGHVRKIDAVGRSIQVAPSTPISRRPWPPGIIYQSSVFWRRALYDRVGGLDLTYNRYATDTELFCRFCRARARFVQVRQVLSSMRVHAAQTTLAESRQVLQFSLRALRTHYPWLGHPVVNPFYRLAFKARHLALLVLQGDGDYVVKMAMQRMRRLVARSYGTATRNAE